nr:hypothetical protein [Tanacetum cinerariifolium]
GKIHDGKSGHGCSSTRCKNLKPLGDDETHIHSISQADKIVNNENNVDKSISETMPVASDKVMETETTNHELQDQEDEKESKLKDKTELMEMSTSSPLEQVDNPLESSTKSDDKDQDLDDDNVNGNDSHDDNVNGNDSHLFNSSVNSKTSYMGPDSGTMDPLEVARQVAMEVERDVDSRERSCSTTSDKTPDSKIRQKSQCKPDGQEIRSQPPLVKDAKTFVSQVFEVAHESVADTVKRFDLNQEVCSEEVDNPVNPVLSTISFVSASQPCAASGLSSTPLQFEGILGLKKSISTSALKPIIDGTHNNSKQRLDCLDFDLNAADEREDKTLPFGEESSDEGCDGHVTFVNQTRWQSPSCSSSSSSKQPSLKNIDLNLSDQPESVVRIFGCNFGVKKNDPPV